MVTVIHSHSYYIHQPSLSLQIFLELMNFLSRRVEVVDNDHGLLVSLADCLVFDVVYRYYVVLGSHYRR